jgi:putative hydrolase
VADNPQFPGPEAFSDVPLLREIQRVLLAGAGPVNWELARQIGIATASWGRDDPEPTADDGRGLEQAVRMAELAVADLTGLNPPAEITQVRAVRRAAWVEANVRGLQGLFEPGAERLARALAEAQEQQRGEGPPGMEMFDALVERMAPLLVGAQVGMVLGSLGQRVLGQYELPLPRKEPALLFVLPNIAAFERDWSLDPVEFRAWVALHETVHAFQLGQPWVRRHFIGLIQELAEGIEFDLSALEQRLEGLDLSNPEQLTQALGQGDLLEGSLNQEQRILLQRVQAFMAAAEGHADHVMAGIGGRILPSFQRIEEARRRHEERSEEERAIERLLGIELKLEQYRLGRSFCERVAEQSDDRTLARMWEGPDALPSMPELEEPTLWLSRMA